VTRRNLPAIIIVAVALLIGAAFVGDVLNVTGGAGRGGTGNEFAGRFVPSGTLGKCQRIARQTGTTISSTWRSASHNRAVGGVANSMHLAGSLARPGACDFSGSFRQYLRVIALCRRGPGPISTETLIHAVPGGGGLHAHCGFVR
jgi:hypothetical protein